MAATSLPRHEREALLRVVTASAAANDLEGVLELAATEARRAIGAGSLSISRFEDGGRRYRTLINVGELGEGEVGFPKDEVYEVSDHARLRRMALTGQPYFNSIDDPETDRATAAMLDRLGKSSDLGVAIEIEGRRWGGIWAATLPGEDSFRAEDLRFLEAVAAQIAAAISRAELFSRVSRLAYEDALTGLANRRAVEERLERATARFAAGEIELSILLCDVDKLKATNDVRGHAAGDEALRRVGAALTASAADYPGSFVGRIGGDEFCVLLEARGEDAAGSQYPRIAELAGAAQRLLAGPDVREGASISCGVASAGAQTATPSALLKAADAAQYLAKRRGGNRICTTAQVGEDGPVAPLAGGGSRERFWKTCEEIIRTLDGELRDAGTLDRLEVVATAFTAAGDFARWAVAYAADGKAYLRDCAVGDNRERRHTGARIAPNELLHELYDLDDYPATRDIVAAGSGSFIARVDDPDGDPSEQELLVREGFCGVIGATAGDAAGVYLIELVSDHPEAPLQEVDAPLRMAIRAAIPPHRHHRDAEPLSRRHSRALELSLALADRLRESAGEQEVCAVAADELERAFGCSIIQIAGIEGDDFVQLARRGPIGDESEWAQKASAGLMGRCLADRRPVISADVTREPGYRSSRRTRAVRSELAVPILDGDGAWGVINLEDTELNAFDEDDARLLESVAAQLSGTIKAIGLYERLDRAYLGTAEALSTALEAKDSSTASHSESITDNAIAVGTQLGMRPEELRMLRYAAAFHDIGKLAIPREILNKPGPLDPAEWTEMKKHTVYGDRILRPIEFLEPIRPVVRHAHERWDGGGYPDGLAGDEIPLGSRIVFACDAYDAMTTTRTYKQAMAAEDARDELVAQAGRQFDPEVVRVLIEVLEQAPARARPCRSAQAVVRSARLDRGDRTTVD
jgi:diguanylate cyclase (GGDEF)-like protein